MSLDALLATLPATLPLDTMREVLTPVYQAIASLPPEARPAAISLVAEKYKAQKLSAKTLGAAVQDLIRAWEAQTQEAQEVQEAQAQEAETNTAPLRWGSHMELAQVLFRASICPETKAPPIYSEGKFWVYAAPTGVWSELTDQALSGQLEALEGTPVGPNHIPLKIQDGTVQGTLKRLSKKVDAPGFFDRAAPGVAFKNGFAVVSANGITLQPHSPKHRARYAYGFDFDAGAEPKLLIETLRERFDQDEDCEQKIAAIQEWSGISRLGLATRYQRALYLFGPLANDGKSTLCTTLQRTFPPDSTCCLTPQELPERFKRAVLAGKLANFVDEAPTSRVEASDILKQAISGKVPITAEYKGRDAFSFVPRAGLFIAGNHFLKSDDQSDGWYRRWVVIDFNRSLRPDQVIVDYEERLLAELPGIVSWSLQGAVRLMTQGRYTLPASHHTRIAEWQGQADAVQAWVESRCEVLPDSEQKDWATLDALHLDFDRWVSRESRSKMARENFGHRLARWRKHTRDGNRYRLKLKELPEEVSAEELDSLISSGDPSVDRMVAVLSGVEPDFDAMSVEELEKYIADHKEGEDVYN